MRPETSPPAVVVQAEAPLVQLEAACRFLAEAKSVADVAGLRDQARAMEVYFRQRNYGVAAMNDAAEIKIRAERRLGELLAESVRPGNPQLSKRSTISRLPAGVSRDDSSRWQRVAQVPAPAFERHVAEVRAAGEELTTAGVLGLRDQLRRDEAARCRAAKREAVSPAGGDAWRVDCADALEWLPRQSAADLVVTSPPYEDARRGLGFTVRRGQAWVDWMVEVVRQGLRVAPLVACVVEGRTEDFRWSATPALLLADLHRAGVCLRKPGCYVRNGIPGSGGPDYFRNDWEFVVIATRGGKLPWSDPTACGHAPKCKAGGQPSHRTANGSRVNAPTGYASMKDRNGQGPHRARMRAGADYLPPDEANPGNVIRCKSSGTSGYANGDTVTAKRYLPPDEANPGNVIRCNGGGGNMGDPLCHENEAPYPEEIPERFIRSFVRSGGLVLDPFVGSGTTGAVAVRLGRRFAGCDVRPEQVELARLRIAAAAPPPGVTPARPAGPKPAAGPGTERGQA
jgi:hypothetical protein